MSRDRWTLRRDASATAGPGPRGPRRCRPARRAGRASVLAPSPCGLPALTAAADRRPRRRLALRQRPAALPRRWSSPARRRRPAGSRSPRRLAGVPAARTGSSPRRSHTLRIDDRDRSWSLVVFLRRRRRGQRRGRARRPAQRRAAARARRGRGARPVWPAPRWPTADARPTCSTRSAQTFGMTPVGPARAADGGRAVVAVERRRARRGASTRAARAGRPRPARCSCAGRRCSPRTGGCSASFADAAAGRAGGPTLAERGGRGRAARGGRPDPRPPCSPRSGTTCARRSPAIKAAVSSLRQPDVDAGPPSERARAARRRSRTGADRLSAGRQPARPQPAAGRALVRVAGARWRSTRSSARALIGLGSRRPRRLDESPTTCRRSSPTPGLLERVVANLVDNARAARAGRAAVDVARGGAAATRAAARWSTTGPASTAADWDAMFAPFQRLRRPLAPAPASGSGLAIARGFAEAMGGTILAASHPRRWPDDDRRPAGAAPAGATDRRAGLTRVLVVDDDPALRARARHQPAGARLRRRRGRRRRAARSRLAAAAPAGRSSSSTSACPTSTASRCSPGCAAGPTRRSSCCRRASDAGRQGRRPRRRRRRLRHQAVRHGRAARPACGRRCAAAAPPPAQPRRRRPTRSPSTSRARRVTDADGEDVRLTPDRVAPARGAGPQPRPAGRPARSCCRRCGARLRDRDQLPAGLHGPAAPQARARRRPPAAPAHRARAWATASSPDARRDLHTWPSSGG